MGLYPYIYVYIICFDVFLCCVAVASSSLLCCGVLTILIITTTILNTNNTHARTYTRTRAPVVRALCLHRCHLLVKLWLHVCRVCWCFCFVCVSYAIATCVLLYTFAFQCTVMRAQARMMAKLWKGTCGCTPNIIPNWRKEFLVEISGR